MAGFGDFGGLGKRRPYSGTPNHIGKGRRREKKGEVRERGVIEM